MCDSVSQHLYVLALILNLYSLYTSNGYLLHPHPPPLPLEKKKSKSTQVGHVVKLTIVCTTILCCINLSTTIDSEFLCLWILVSQLCKCLAMHPIFMYIVSLCSLASCLIFVFLFSISLTGSFILASSVKMNNSIPHVRTVWTDSFGDIGIYTGNTLKVVSYM